MAQLQYATLTELNQDLSTEKSGGQKVRVQFNPETLKVSFSTQTASPSKTASASGSPQTGDQASGTSGRQYLGAGSTKLSLVLWFDCSAATEPDFQVDDVRKLTQQVVYFLMAQETPQGSKKYVPPGVRFQWGCFKFDGLVDSLEENLEFFSSEGRPLRAQVSLGLSQQSILVQQFGPSGQPNVPGTKPLAQASAGSTLQGLVDAAGGGDWQSVAQANGIENPRQLAPGSLIQLSIG